VALVVLRLHNFERPAGSYHWQ